MTSAVSCFVRPHLNELLDFANVNFEYTVLFTTAPVEHVKEIQNRLYQLGEVPLSFQQLPCIQWSRRGKKDLRLVSERWQEVIMLDDNPTQFMLEEQKSQWLSIKPFHGEHDDTELLDSVKQLKEKLGL